MTEVRVGYGASDRKRGLTLRELAEFLSECRMAGVDLDAAVEVGVGWRAQVQRVEVAGEQTRGHSYGVGRLVQPLNAGPPPAPEPLEVRHSASGPGLAFRRQE